MRGVERTGNLDRDRDRVGERKPGSLVCQPSRERFADDQLHDEKPGARILADIVERAHVPVIQMRTRFRFTFESFAESCIGGEVRRQDLDSDSAVEARVLRAIHLTHAAGAERRFNFVRTESCASSRALRECEILACAAAAILEPDQ